MARDDAVHFNGFCRMAVRVEDEHHRGSGAPDARHACAQVFRTTLSAICLHHPNGLPWHERGAIAALIGAHLYLVTKLGTTAPPWLKAEPYELPRETEV